MERNVMKTGRKMITVLALALFMLAVAAGVPGIAEKNAGYTGEFTCNGNHAPLMQNRLESLSRNDFSDILFARGGASE